MIALNLDGAFLLYLGLALLLVIFAWMRHEARARRRRVLPPQRVVVACEYCAKEYTRPFEKPLSRCPQCQALNVEKKGGEP